LLPAVCGACLAAQYLFMIGYAAPRFLLPAYAVLAIPVADAVAFVIGAVRLDVRPVAAAAVVVVLTVQVVSQVLVLNHEVTGSVAFHDDYSVIASRLAALGVRPPCLVNGDQYIPIAFLAGCASTASVSSGGSRGSGGSKALLVIDGYRPPWYAQHWHPHRIGGTQVLHVTAYLPLGVLANALGADL
jgi:hypothetical protein